MNNIVTLVSDKKEQLFDFSIKDSLKIDKRNLTQPQTDSLADRTNHICRSLKFT